MKRLKIMIAATAALSLGVVPAFADGWPSTNEANVASDDPHVVLIEATADAVTLELVSDKDYAVNFEIRVDGQTPTTYASGDPVTANQVVAADGSYDPLSDAAFAEAGPETRDVIYPGCNVWSGFAGYGDYCPGDWDFVDGRLLVTIDADAKVEVRQALGAESSHRFDWVTFEVLQQADPASRDDCQDGGFEAFGFDNQGRCVQFVNTGRDSR